jgi:hypothetical protein
MEIKAAVPKTLGIEKLLNDPSLVDRVHTMRDDLSRILVETQRALTSKGDPDSIGHAVLGIRAVDEVFEFLASKGAENKRASNTTT